MLGNTIVVFRSAKVAPETIFLACKTKDRTRQGAQKELENSLKLLKTDYFDLYQLHCIVKPDEDVERAFAPDSVMEMIFKAKEQGKIRNIGFSAWLNLTKRAIEAGEKFRKISDADIAKLREMAAKSVSVFHTQRQVARHDWQGTDCPFGPHEECPGAIG